MSNSYIRSALTFVASLGCVSTLLAQPSFYPVPTPEGSLTTATAISADGSTVAGTLITLTPDRTQLGYFWRVGGALEMLPPPSESRLPEVYHLSGDGSVMVGAYDGGVGLIPFKYQAATGYDFFVGIPGNSIATSISDDGANTLITGAHDTTFPDTAYLVSEDGSFVALPRYGLGTPTIYANDVSADGTTVVGGGFPFPVQGFQAFRWRESTGLVLLDDLPGGAIGGYGYATSADGSVVVGASFSGNSAFSEACKWDADGEALGLGDLPGGEFFSRAQGVSADGRIIVGWGMKEGGSVCMIWDEHNGMRDLREVLVQMGLGEQLKGWTLMGARGISADGRRICGTGRNPTFSNQGWVVDLGPGTPPCPTDFNGDGVLNTQDFFDYIVAFFTVCEPPPPAGCPADFNRDGDVNSQDFFEYLAAFLAGCE